MNAPSRLAGADGCQSLIGRRDTCVALAPILPSGIAQGKWPEAVKPRLFPCFNCAFHIPATITFFSFSLSLFLSFFLSLFLSPFPILFQFSTLFLSKDSSPLPQMLPKIPQFRHQFRPQFRFGSLLSPSLSPPLPSPREILREPSRFPGKMLPRQPTPTGHAFIDSFLSTGINPRPYLSRQPHFLEML